MIKWCFFKRAQPPPKPLLMPLCLPPNVKKSLTAHSPSMDSHNLLNYAHQFFKHLFIQLGKNNLPQLTSVFLSIVAAADE